MKDRGQRNLKEIDRGHFCTLKKKKRIKEVEEKNKKKQKKRKEKERKKERSCEHESADNGIMNYDIQKGNGIVLN